MTKALKPLSEKRAFNRLAKELKSERKKAQPAPVKTFDTFEDVAGMSACMKKPIIVHAKRIDEEFRVNSLEGNYKQGKPGDYLMRGIDGELYICDRAIFEKTYDWV